MLTELRIRDVGVIADAVLEPGPGFTVISGETGAGKTMVVTGLALLLGEKADRRLIRRGATRAVVEGRFEVNTDVEAVARELGADLDDHELIVSRQITSARSRSSVGGMGVPVVAAAGVLSSWVTLHGQSEQIRLGTAQRQREVVDHHAGAEFSELLDRYRAAYAHRQRLSAELEALTAAARERARELDLLVFGLDEIQRVAPQPAEDQALAAEAQRLQSADDLRQAASEALAAVAGTTDDLDAVDATGLIATARKQLDTARATDDALASVVERLSAVGYEIADIAQTIATYLADLEADPARLEQIAARRAELQTLTRKYGATIDEVLAWAEESAVRVEELQGADERIEELDRTVADLTEQLATWARELTVLRTAASEALADAATQELTALAMPHAVVRFSITPRDSLGPDGADEVSLLFAANAASTPEPLAKVASGGELSRVRLALEVVLAGETPGQVFIFDEVDAGIGGATALEVGRRLQVLARHSQVLVVTHLAQVAAFADRHFVVSKADEGQVTTSGIVAVDGTERIDEIARMMSGEVTPAAQARAAELIDTGTNAAEARSL